MNNTPDLLDESPIARVRFGAGNCTTAELLSVLLRRRDVAQRVMESAGTVYGLARLTAADLEAVQGIGESGSASVLAAVELAKRLAHAVPDDRPAIKAPADAANLLMYQMMGYDQEYLYVILLDTRNRVIGKPVEVYHGSLNTSLIRVGEIFRHAIKVNAAAVIVVHNHPSGQPDPSPEDVAVTRAIVEAGKLLDIDVLDHVVIGANRFVSLKERGLGF